MANTNEKRQLNSNALTSEVVHTLPESKGLQLLIECLDLPDYDCLAFVVDELNQLLGRVAWLESELCLATGDAKTVDALRVLQDRLSSSDRFNTYVFRRAYETLPYFAAIAVQKYPGGYSVWALRGIFLLALVQLRVHREPSVTSQRGDVPQKAAVDDLASTLRALSTRENRPVNDLLNPIRESGSADDFIRHLIGAIQRASSSNKPKHGAGSFFHAIGQLDPWLSRGGWRNGATAPPPEQPIERTPRFEAAPSMPRFDRGGEAPAFAEAGSSLKGVGTGAGERGLGEEGKEELQISITYATVPDDLPRAAGLKQELQRARGRLWRLNPDFDLNHLSVISDAELAVLVPALRRRIMADLAARRPDHAEWGLLVALSLVTGRPSSTLARLFVGNAVDSSLDRLSIALDRGVLVMPVIRPDSAFKPTDEWTDLYEPTAAELQLPLPPELVTLLREYHAFGLSTFLSVQALTQQPHALEDKGDDAAEARELLRPLDRYLKKYLRSMLELPPSAVSISRIRQRFLAQVQAVSGDLAAVMLLAGDSFGASTAPLYYYTPRRQDLARTYIHAAWPLWGDALRAVPVIKGRVGAEGLPKADEVRARVRTLAGQLNLPKSIKNYPVEIWIASIHNRFARHVAAMFCVMTSHRPTKALFRLTRWDLNLVDHAAVLRDKDVDPAHRVRLVAMPPQLSEQISLYLSHLQALAARSEATPALCNHIRAVLVGEAPLFFPISERLELLEVSEFKDWLMPIPDSWKNLQPNWWRTATPMALREAGIPAGLVHIQQGHLEAAGRPFASDSALSPREFVEPVSFGLQKIWKEQGWTIRTALSSKPLSRFAELPPLKDWTEEIRRNEEEARSVRIGMRKELRRIRKDSMEEAGGLAIDHIRFVDSRLADELMELIVRRPKPLRSPWRPKDRQGEPGTLTQAQLQKIQSTADEHPKAGIGAMKIAFHNRLALLLRRARGELGWQVPDLRLWLPGPDVEPSPFLPSMMLACHQVHAIRRYLMKQTAPVSGDALYAKCCLILLLYTPYSLEQIRRVLDDGLQGERVPSMDDAVAVELTGRDWVAIARGGPALAVAALTQKVMPEKPSSDKILEQQIATLLPDWCVGVTQQGLLERLERAVQITRIYELSPLARIAIGPDGATSAPWNFQRAYLANAMIDSSSRLSNGASAIGEVERTEQKPVKTIQAREARSSYAALMAILNVEKGRAQELERTEVTLHRAHGSAAAAARAREVEAFLEAYEGEPTSIAFCLGDFALDLIRNGTDQKALLAPATISTYLSRIGAPLVERVAAADLGELSTEDFEDLYESVLDTHGGHAAIQAATQLMRFHDLLMKRLGVEDIDRGVLRQHLSRSVHRADAQFITNPEYELALQSLIKGLRPEFEYAPQRRLDQACAVALILIRATGARSSEIFSVRHRDLILTGDKVTLMIRPTRYSWLKTQAASRLVSIGERINSAERELILAWRQQETQRLSRRFDDALPLLGNELNIMEPIVFADIRSRLISVLSQICNRPVKLHHFRHSWVHQELLKILSGNNAKKSTNVMPMHRAIRAITHEIGHRGIQTTITNYFHVPWALSNYEFARESYCVERASLSAVGNRNGASIDKVGERAGIKQDDYARFLELMKVEFGQAKRSRVDPEISELINVESPRSRHLTATAFAGKIRSVGKSESPVASLEAVGFSRSAAQDICMWAGELRNICGYNLLNVSPEFSSDAQLREVRILRAGNPFASWLRLYDTQSGSSRKTAEQLALLIEKGYSPSGRSTLQLTAEGQKTFVTEISKIPDVSIFLVDVSTGVGLSRHEVKVYLKKDMRMHSVMPLLLWTLATMWIFGKLRQGDPTERASLLGS